MLGSYAGLGGAGCDWPCNRGVDQLRARIGKITIISSSFTRIGPEHE